MKGEKCLCSDMLLLLEVKTLGHGEIMDQGGGPLLLKKKKSIFSCILYNSENSSNRKFGILKKSL